VQIESFILPLSVAHIAAPLSGPNILPGALFSSALYLRASCLLQEMKFHIALTYTFSLKVRTVATRSEDAHCSKVTGNIIVLCILIFALSRSRRKDKVLCPAEFSLPVNFFVIQVWFVPIIPNYLNFHSN
jgi:hypothetical protein